MAKKWTSGDFLALQSLDKWREKAFSRGYMMTRAPKVSADVQMQRLAEKGLERIGDPVVQPAGTGDVGSGARPSQRDPQPVSALINRFIKERGWQQRLEVTSVFARWPQIVGENVAKHVVVESFDEAGKLVVRADSRVWETQIRAVAGELDAILSREIGPDVVKSIEILGPKRPEWKRSYKRREQ